MKTPYQVLPLADWARWFAFLEVSETLVIQVASLKLPRWEASFLPVFCRRKDSNISALFEFPKDLTEAGRSPYRFTEWPSEIWRNPASQEILLDCYLNPDYPAAPRVKAK